MTPHGICQLLQYSCCGQFVAVYLYMACCWRILIHDIVLWYIGTWHVVAACWHVTCCCTVLVPYSLLQYIGLVMHARGRLEQGIHNMRADAKEKHRGSYLPQLLCITYTWRLVAEYRCMPCCCTALLVRV